MRMMLSFLEDVIIENKQAMEMSRICLHILNENDPGMCNYHLIQSQHRDEIPGVMIAGIYGMNVSLIQ